MPNSPSASQAAGDDHVATESGAMRPKVSVVVTTFNEEHNIAACLETLLWADEILVVDSFSEDRTPEIVQDYEQVTFVQRTYFGSAAQKNWAMDQCKNPWILIFDADERCTPKLREEIEELLASGPDHEAYTIRRKVFFLGKVIHFSGWQRDQVVRLVRQGAGRYPNRRVHADMKTRGAAPLLKHRMDHYMVDDFHEYVLRIVKYSRWGAAQGWRDGRRPGFNEVCLRSVWRFVRTYVVQGGVFDGMRGIVFCMLQAYGTYVKWSLLWSWRVNEQRGMKPNLPAFDENEETWHGLKDLG
ncbi:MAG: glycosyltransferase family 2 protein [Thermoanaerobaculia bacterium]|nr:glycosyltransferase family 2 protein [Thermoanaerobaculia bacterium]